LLKLINVNTNIFETMQLCTKRTSPHPPIWSRIPSHVCGSDGTPCSLVVANVVSIERVMFERFMAREVQAHVRWMMNLYFVDATPSNTFSRNVIRQVLEADRLVLESSALIRRQQSLEERM
jgi:hypothetical protein